MAVDPRFQQGNSVQLIPGQVPAQIPGFYPCDNNTFAAGGPAVVFGNNLPAASVGVGGNTKTLTPVNPGASVGHIPTNNALAGPNPNVLPTQCTAGVGQGAAASGALNSSAQGPALNAGVFNQLVGASTGLLGNGELTTANVAN